MEEYDEHLLYGTYVALGIMGFLVCLAINVINEYVILSSTPWWVYIIIVAVFTEIIFFSKKHYKKSEWIEKDGTVDTGNIILLKLGALLTSLPMMGLLVILVTLIETFLGHGVESLCVLGIIFLVGLVFYVWIKSNQLIVNLNNNN